MCWLAERHVPGASAAVPARMFSPAQTMFVAGEELAPPSGQWLTRDELLDAVTERFVSSLRLPAGGQPWPDWGPSLHVNIASLD